MKKSRASLKQTTASGCSHRCGSGSRMHSSASMQQWRALNFAADGAERLWQSLWEKNETRLNQFLNSCGDYQTKLICINTHSSWIFDITRRCHLHCSTNGAEGNVWLFIFGGWLRDAKGTTIHGALFLFALAPVLPSNRAPSFCHGMPTKSPQIWSPDSSGRGPIGRSTWHGQCLEIFEIIRTLQGTSVTPNRDRVRPDGGANDASKGGPFQKMINFPSRKLPNGPPCPSNKGIDGDHGGWFESALKHLSYPYIQPFDM